MSGETGVGAREQEYRTLMRVRESAAEPRGRLELLMDRCASSGNAMVVRDEAMMAFRRGGMVYALATGGIGADIGMMRTAEERQAADALAEKIRSGEIEHSACRSNGPADSFCIASLPYYPGRDSGREYGIPENARMVRVGRRKIKFYAGELPRQNDSTDDRRRKYYLIPEGAVKVRRVAGAFEWLTPESDGCKWKKP